MGRKSVFIYCFLFLSDRQTNKHEWKISIPDFKHVLSIGKAFSGERRENPGQARFPLMMKRLLVCVSRRLIPMLDLAECFVAINEINDSFRNEDKKIKSSNSNIQSRSKPLAQ